MKTCSRCRGEKPDTDFYTNQNNCIVCSKEYAKLWGVANRERKAVNEKRWREANPARKRELRRAACLRQYGLTPGAYADLLAEQGGGCAICGLEPQGKPLAVDHDHETGAVRGLLCDNCNQSLGKMKDDPERLMRAAQYLTRSSENRKEYQHVSYPEHC